MQQSKPNIFRKIARLFAASTLVIFLYLMINLILLGILNLRGLWDVFVSPATGSISSQDVSPLTDALNSVQAKLDTPFVYLFWILVGCIAYSIVASLQYAIAISKKQAKESRFLHAGQVRTTDYWRSTTTINLLLLTSAVSAVIYAILYFKFLLPGISRLFYRGLYCPSHYHGVIYVLGSVLAGAVTLYVFVLLCQIVRYRWHTVRPI